MNLADSMKQLDDLCSSQDWFEEVGVDEFNRLVVYTHKMDKDILRFVPDKINNIQVLVHFVESKRAKREDFVAYEHKPFELVKEIFSIEELSSDELDSDIDDLIRELDRLEQICGSNILQDIFFEVHDGKNAITNLSAIYPNVKSGMEKLYNEYGFDIIYDNMDG